MPLFRSASAETLDKARSESLLTPEEIGERRRRRWLWIALSASTALIVLGCLTARPIAREIKAWQARRAAAQALGFVDQGKWREARNKVQDAIQLRGNEPEVLRATAIFLTRVENFREAAAFWKQLEAARPLTPAEQRDYGTALLRIGELDEAESRLRRAWPDGQTGKSADWHAALQLAALRHDAATAAELAGKLLADPAANNRQRLDAALTLSSLGNADTQTTALDAIRQIARGKDQESLEALTLLARQAAQAIQTSKAAPKNVLPIDEIAAALEAHPLARIQHRLLAVDLRLARDPAQHDAIIQAAIAKFGGGDSEALAGLGSWLYGKGEFAKTLEVIPLEKAVSNRALYLQHLDALAALGRWAEIEDLIKGQRFTLDPVVEQMYLARCSAQRGQPESRDVHWNAALQAAGADVDKLMGLGVYAQKGGSLAVAENAYRAALGASPDSRPANEALIAVLQAQGKTAPLREAVQAMLNRWPEDESVINDAAYLDALLNRNVPAARDAARQLIKEAPESLPHKVTLALAELRLGHALTALDALGGYGNFPATAATGQQLAVYAAVLWETGAYNAEAKAAATRAASVALLPEERELVRPIIESP